MTLPEYLDEVFCEYGFFLEKGGNLTFEGAEGAAKIERLVASYAGQPPREIEGVAVTASRDHAVQEIRDSEGDLLPKEKMLVIALADGRRIAVRPSGTEPKIKFYMFAQRAPASGEKFDAAQLARIKAEVSASLEALWSWIQRDVDARLS
jgi:phosphoglucomutase